jgi:hypothetical protein
MKLFIKTLFVSLFSLLLGSCYVDNGDEGMVGEQNLVVALDPTPGTLVQTLGTTYNFKVLVQSQMPAQGVTVSVVYRQDSDDTIVFSQNYTTTTSPLDVAITNIPFNEVGTVTIVVTSKTKTDNTVTKTFKLVRK